MSTAYRAPEADPVAAAALAAHVATDASDAELTAHEADTTNVHGISDTAQLARLSVNQTFTKGQAFTPDTAGAVALAVNSRSTQDYSETSIVQTRPVANHMHFTAAPASVPGLAVDYHGVDLVMDCAGSLALPSVGLYPFESNAQYSGSGSMGRLVAGYLFANNTGNGSVAELLGLQTLQRNRGTGNVPLMRGLRVRTPVNDGGGTVDVAYGLHIESFAGVTGIAAAYALYCEGGDSWHAGRMLLGGPAAPASPLGTLDVRSQPTGGAALNIAPIAGQTAPLITLRDTSNNAIVQWTIGADGGVITPRGLNVDQFGAAVVDAAACLALRPKAANTGVVLRGATSQTANLLEARDPDNVVGCTFTENGYFTTRKTTAPADAELVAGEAAYWLDATNGAAKFKIKAKQANGTVVAGEVALT
jgi:hypothetical protein